jgi:hypothetical protein
MIRSVAIFAAALLLNGVRDTPALIDNFENVSGWKAVPSDGVSLSISQDVGAHGKSMRLDFDFHGHGGYAVVHKDLGVDLPANYEFTFAVRGESPSNNLEFKLIDPTGDNVWWSNQRDFVFRRQWKSVTLKKRQITFAWGPLGGGEMKRVNAIEFAITAGSGGKGTVWIDDLALNPLEPDTPYNLSPKIVASSSGVNIDFLKRREFGGLVIGWPKGRRPSGYVVLGSKDAAAWDTLYTVTRGAGIADWLFLPESDARYVRVIYTRGSPEGMPNIFVAPLAFSESLNDFYFAMAGQSKPGYLPKYFSNEETYWTVLGVDGDTREALINDQGALETGKGQFSIEPFLYARRLLTWRDATKSASSLHGDLPIKTVTWETPELSLDVTAFAAGIPEASTLYARYRVHNKSARRQAAKLFLAIRPFQVNPPWQFLNTQGGVATIDKISFDGRTVSVNGNRRVIPLTRPSAFGAQEFDEGNIADAFALNSVPASKSVTDHFGHASGALAYNLDLPPNGDADVDISVPLHEAAPRDAYETALSAITAEWNRKQNLVRVELPGSASRLTETMRSQLAYILINRDGPGIQPGSRSYERSWIRDGSLTSTALLRLGHFQEVRDFINWYAKYQFDNGKIPCCVDSRGADPVPENDSHGEFIYLIAEYYRHTGDRALLENMWPHVAKAWTFMDSLRRSRMTPEYQQGDKRVFYGLLPQSISHEGYSAKPMHSYWDDFFALRGFKDAAEIARILGNPESSQYAAVRDEFRKDFYASIQLSMEQHHIDYIPGAAELGDFDATSTTIALTPADELGRLPQPALNRTFDKYWENFVARRDGKIQWDGYTPYEWRVVGSFIRLGQKQRAHAAVNFFFLGQRPSEWRQWAEVVYRDPKTPKFVGDMPHTWVGSDFIRSFLDMLAYEREQDSSLVIGAGVLPEWVNEDRGITVSNLSTHYGRLSYSMHGSQNSVELSVSGPRIPPGGLVIESPYARSIRGSTLNGQRVPATRDAVVIRSLPARVVLRY